MTQHYPTAHELALHTAASVYPSFGTWPKADQDAEIERIAARVRALDASTRRLAAVGVKPSSPRVVSSTRPTAARAPVAPAKTASRPAPTPPAKTVSKTTPKPTAPQTATQRGPVMTRKDREIQELQVARRSLEKSQRQASARGDTAQAASSAELLGHINTRLRELGVRVPAPAATHAERMALEHMGRVMGVAPRPRSVEHRGGSVFFSAAGAARRNA